MDEDLRIIASTEDADDARAWGLVLEAVALPHRVIDRHMEALPFDDAEHAARFCLVVSAEDVDRAHALLDAEREEEHQRRAARGRLIEERPRASDGRAWGVTFAFALLLVLVYLRSPGFDADISRALRVDAGRILQGEWWRLIGGALLHADPGHLAGNLSFLLPLGYFCVRRFGAGAFLFGFVVTAALGFLASVCWHGAPYHSLGASGGMFGLFGLLVGAAMAEPAPHRDPKQRRRELIGAALGLMGMTAFGRGADDPSEVDLFMRFSQRVDVLAHVFGFLSGLVLGAVLIRVRRSVIDAGLGLLAALVLVLSLLSACGPSRGSVRTEAITPDETGAYRLEEVVLEGLSDFEHMVGETLVFTGAARFQITLETANGRCSVSGAPCTSTATELRSAVLRNPKDPVEPRFFHDRGVARPMDSDTLHLTTAYYHLFAAQRFFASLQVDPTPELGALAVHYHPDTESLRAFRLTPTDNAAYFRLSDGLLLVPMHALQQVPLGMNRGVLFHEYFHRVFSWRVWGARPLAPLLVTSEAEDRAVRMLSALDEGVADFFGALGANDPAFVQKSAPERTAAARDLATKHVFQREWYDATAPLSGERYDPYPAGTCFAAWLWQLQAALGKDAVIAAWFAADTSFVPSLATLDFPTIVSRIIAGFADRSLPCRTAAEVWFGKEFAACR